MMKNTLTLPATQHCSNIIGNASNIIAATLLYSSNTIIEEKTMEVTIKLTKSEKKFISWLENEIKRRKKNTYIHNNQKWITITQEELAKELGVSRQTIWSVTKRLMKLGIIEEEKLSMEFSNKYPEDGYYRDHTYSYTFTLKGREMTATTRHGTSLVNAYDLGDIICDDIITGAIKLTKSEKKFIRWLGNSLIRYESTGGENNTYILNNKKWVAAPQEELVKELGVTGRTICSVTKRLMKLGIIERDHSYHIYSYTLKGWKMADSHVADMKDSEKNFKSFTSNINLNNKLFKYNKSLINHYDRKNHDSEIIKKDTSADASAVAREIPQVEESKTSKVITTKTPPVVTIREMYDATKEVLGDKVSFKLTKEISRWMGAARNAYFQTLDKWRSFLEAIKRSCYLMGEKFLLTIKWILKFKTIGKILAGEYDSFEEKKKRIEEEWNRKLEEREEEMEKLDLQMEKELENGTENPKCVKAKGELLQKVGGASFMSWFREANWVEEHGKVIVEVESNFRYDTIGNRYGHELESLGIGLRKVNV